MEPRVSVITLGVGNLETATRFYEQGLGLKRSPASNPLIVYYEFRGFWLALFPLDQMAIDKQLPEEQLGKGAVTLAHHVARREAVDAILRQAVEAGGRLHKPAHETDWGGYAGYFADPDGHLWEVAWDEQLPI